MTSQETAQAIAFKVGDADYSTLINHKDGKIVIQHSGANSIIYIEGFSKSNRKDAHSPFFNSLQNAVKCYDDVMDAMKSVEDGDVENGLIKIKKMLGIEN